MDKKNIIIILLLLANVILLVLVFKPQNNKKNTTPINNVVGIYHNSNWNKMDATIVLNEDMTCQYPSSSETCTYDINNNVITMTLIDYYIAYDNTNEISISSFSNTLEQCNTALYNFELVNTLVNGRCEERKSNHNATIAGSSIVLHDHVFNKVN